MASSSSSSSVLDLPVGYIFQPTDEELLGYYLYNKICGTPFKYDSVVPETKLYRNSIEPEDIWTDLDGPKLPKNQDLYFFTTLKKVRDKGSRVARKAGSGSWKGENSGTKVYYFDANKKKHILGLWKRFHYENNQSDKQNDSWILHEYSLDESLMPKSSNSSSSTGDDQEQYVLCRLRKKVDKKRKLLVAAAADNIALNKIPRLAIENYIGESCQGLIMSEVVDQVTDHINTVTVTEPQTGGLISGHQSHADPGDGLMTTQQPESDLEMINETLNDIDDDAFLIDLSSLWDIPDQSINTALEQVLPYDHHDDENHTHTGQVLTTSEETVGQVLTDGQEMMMMRTSDHQMNDDISHTHTQAITSTGGYSDNIDQPTENIGFGTMDQEKGPQFDYYAMQPAFTTHHDHYHDYRLHQSSNDQYHEADDMCWSLPLVGRDI